MDERVQILLQRAKSIEKSRKTSPLSEVNLFSVLNMEHKEVSAHSAVLYYIFCPFEDENGLRDDQNLRILLKNFGEKIAKDVRLELFREVWTDFGRLDFLIAAGEEKYVLELKIWAGEQPMQLSRYAQYLKREGGKEENIFFLTPEERTPSSGNARCVTLKDEVARILKEILALRCDKKSYCEMIGQYLKVIENITGGHTMKAERGMITSSEELLIVNSLVDEQTAILTRLLREFFAAMEERLGEEIAIEGFPKAIKVPYEYGAQSIEEYYGGGKRTYPAIAYRIEGKDVGETGLYFFLEISSALYAGITPRKKEADGGFSCVSTHEERFRTFLGKRPSKFFLDWDYVENNGGALDFTRTADKDSFCRKLLRKDSLTFDEKKLDEVAAAVLWLYKGLCRRVFKLSEN